MISRMKTANDASWIPRALAELYESGRIEITKKTKQKFKEGRAAVEHKGCLCMKTDYLMKLLEGPLANQDLTVKELTNALRKDGLLSMDKSGRSTKKLNGVRVLQIHIDHLCELYGSEDIFADVR